jgi:hypothetical protein
MLGLEPDEGKLNEPLGFETFDEEGNRPDEVRGRSRSYPSAAVVAVAAAAADDDDSPFPDRFVLQSSMTESLREVGRCGSSKPSVQSRPDLVPGLDEVRGLAGSLSSSDEGYGRFRLNGLVL